MPARRTRARTPEGAVQRACLDLLRYRGVLAWRFNSISDIMKRAERGIRLPRPALTTSTNIGGWHVMVAQHDITPTTQILDDAGRDWAWAFVIFKPVVGFPGYLVGSNGSVWSCWRHIGRVYNFDVVMTDQWRLLKPFPKGRCGHLAMRIRCKGRRWYPYLHRVVLEAFIGPRPAGKECCHNDGKFLNNSIRNLRWDTHFANMVDRSLHGRTAFGERGGRAKLTEIDVLRIWELSATGLTLHKLGDMYGVHNSTISSILRGKIWKHLNLPVRKRQR